MEKNVAPVVSYTSLFLTHEPSCESNSIKGYPGEKEWSPSLPRSQKLGADKGRKGNMVEKPRAEGQYTIYFRTFYFIPLVSIILIIHNVIISGKIGQLKTIFLLSAKHHAG